MKTPALALTILLLLPSLALAQAKPKWSPEYERKVGLEAVAQVEKQMKVVTDEAQQKRLDQIVTSLGTVSLRPEVKYTVKIVDDNEINAFSIPGGFIYVTKGLLEDAQSDHELAGVISHEITHNAFYDALERGEKNKKLFMGSIAAALGALLLGAEGNEISTVLAAGEYIRLGVLSKYSMTVETRADTEAVDCLLATKTYNPVGMLTFMERLAARERRRPKVEMGVYADHPDTDKRCQKIIERLENAGVDVNRRAVTKWDPHCPPSAKSRAKSSLPSPSGASKSSPPTPQPTVNLLSNASRSSRSPSASPSPMACKTTKSSLKPEPTRRRSASARSLGFQSLPKTRRPSASHPPTWPARLRAASPPLSTRKTSTAGGKPHHRRRPPNPPSRPSPHPPHPRRPPSLDTNSPPRLESPNT